MRLISVGSVAALLLISCGLQAEAAPIVYTYTGSVSYGYDYTGVFGTAGKALTGESYKVIETFDVANAVVLTNGFSYSEAYGGTGYGAGSGFATSQVTIGGVTAPTISGDYADLLYNIKSFTHEDSVEMFSPRSFGQSYTRFTSYSASTPLSYTDATPSGQIDPSSGGNYYIYQLNGDGTSGQAYAGFTIDSVTVSNGVSSVPLPASAPMFGAALLALGAVGYGMKRKASATA